MKNKIIQTKILIQTLIMMKMLYNNNNYKISKISFKMQKLYQNQQQTQEVLNKLKI